MSRSCVNLENFLNLLSFPTKRSHYRTKAILHHWHINPIPFNKSKNISMETDWKSLEKPNELRSEKLLGQSTITRLSGWVPEFCDRGHAAEERRSEDQVGAVRVCGHPGRVRRLHLQRGFVQVEGKLFSNRFLVFLFRGRAVPPRLFCDICDEFDLHDTEDCPTQVWHHSKVLCCCFSLSFHFKIFHTRKHENKLSGFFNSGWGGKESHEKEQQTWIGNINFHHSHFPKVTMKNRKFKALRDKYYLSLWLAIQGARVLWHLRGFRTFHRELHRSGILLVWKTSCLSIWVPS